MSKHSPNHARFLEIKEVKEIREKIRKTKYGKYAKTYLILKTKNNVHVFIGTEPGTQHNYQTKDDEVYMASFAMKELPNVTSGGFYIPGHLSRKPIGSVENKLYDEVIKDLGI
jgi:hypothetical protein